MKVKISTDRLPYRTFSFLKKKDGIKNLFTLNSLNTNENISLLTNMNTNMNIVSETNYTLTNKLRLKCRI